MRPAPLVTAILNPAAGRGRVGCMAARLEAALRQSAGERPLLFFHTRAPSNAVELAHQAPAGSRVVAVGSDGTVHEVIRGIAHGGKSLGVVPIGSGNDFARMAGLRGLSLAESLQVALGYETRPFDLRAWQHACEPLPRRRSGGSSPPRPFFP